MEAMPAPDALEAVEKTITQKGNFTFFLNHQGKKRFYKLHVPSSYDPQKPVALIISLHGGGGNMDYQADESKYKLISKSEKEGFIIAFPNGFSKINSGKFATWNAGNCCGLSREHGVDDVGFIKEIVRITSKQFSIDTRRIYATGMSNGGMMSYRLACEAADIFAAIAPVAGTDNTTNCSPSKPVSLLHIHAKNDDHVLFNGGIGPEANKDKKFITNFSSVPDSIKKWIKINECNDKPKRVLEIKDAYCDLYSECKKNIQVKLCVTESGGHSWPGGGQFRGVTPTSAISANDMMWTFFQENTKLPYKNGDKF